MALKIDKSFVDTVGQDAASSSVASHIIEMAATLDGQVIAEGIEREEQAAYLLARGVLFGQGWLFSAPLTAAEFIRFAGLDRARFGLICCASTLEEPSGATKEPRP